jgi:hypothetical protein
MKRSLAMLAMPLVAALAAAEDLMPAPTPEFKVYRLRGEKYPGQRTEFLRGSWKGDGIPCTMTTKARKPRSR